MCVTAAIGSFIMSAASAVAGFAQQQAQYKAQQQRYENNKKASNAAAVNRYASQQNQDIQERKAASEEKQKLNIKAAKARATAQTAAGEAGVTGLSVDALVNDFYGEEGRHERTLDNNYAMKHDYIRGEMDVTEANTASRINSVSQGIKPSFAGAAIRILGAGVKAFA